MAKGARVVPARQSGTGKGKGKAGGRNQGARILPSGGKRKSRYAQG